MIHESECRVVWSEDEDEMRAFAKKHKLPDWMLRRGPFTGKPQEMFYVILKPEHREGAAGEAGR